MTTKKSDPGYRYDAFNPTLLSDPAGPLTYSYDEYYSFRDSPSCDPLNGLGSLLNFSYCPGPVRAMVWERAGDQDEEHPRPHVIVEARPNS